MSVSAGQLPAVLFAGFGLVQHSGSAAVTLLLLVVCRDSKALLTYLWCSTDHRRVPLA